MLKKRLRKKTSIVYTPLRWSRYSLQTDYGPTISGYNDYIKQQNMFLNCLNNDVSQYLIIKNKGEDFGQNTLQRIVPNGKKFTVIDQEITFQQLMKKAVLHVSTYNGQTHLETMRMNYPTILFWDPDHWLLNKEAAKYHKKLQDVGVFHTTPKSAAVFINHNYRGINDWWFSSEVQSEVDSFVDKYAKRVSSWSMIKKLNLEINNN